MGPEGRERLPRLSKEEIADVTPCRRSVREMLKSVAFPYYLLTSAFSGFAPGRLAGALRAGTFSYVPQMAPSWVRGHQNFGGG